MLNTRHIDHTSAVTTISAFIKRAEVFLPA